MTPPPTTPKRIDPYIQESGYWETSPFTIIRKLEEQVELLTGTVNELIDIFNAIEGKNK